MQVGLGSGLEANQTVFNNLTYFFLWFDNILGWNIIMYTSTYVMSRCFFSGLFFSYVS